MMRSESEPWLVPIRIAIPRCLAQPNQGREAFPNPLQFGGVLFIRVFDDLELLRVGVIPRVDPNFFDPLRRLHGGFRFEMNVGHDRHVAAAAAQTAHDMFQIRRVLDRRRGDSHDLAPAAASSIVWAIDASVSIVSHVIIDWTRIGFAPPTPTPPIITSRVTRR